MARWPSGEAEDCKSFNAGSIPARASRYYWKHMAKKIDEDATKLSAVVSAAAVGGAMGGLPGAAIGGVIGYFVGDHYVAEEKRKNQKAKNKSAKGK